MNLALLLQLIRWLGANKDKAKEVVMLLLGAFDLIQQAVQKIKDAFQDLPSASAMSQEQAQEYCVKVLTEELEALGFTGERLKKVVQLLGPFIEKYLIPFLLSKLVGQGVSMNDQATAVAMQQQAENESAAQAAAKPDKKKS